MIELRHLRTVILCAAGVVALGGCAEVEDQTEPEEIVLGPADGHELPPADLERISAGDVAPDFAAMSSTGEPIRLSSYRGEKNVVLFFYRGHW